MFASVLIANRGEIACRIIKTAQRLGLRTIAVHSDADRDALHVRMADEAHFIGPAPPAQSYLGIERVIEAARRSGAECIHPGYGFLSENADFAEACERERIVFIGPPPAAIRAMGLKDRAKALMQAAGVPVVPGDHGEDQDAERLFQAAKAIGFPLLIKAVAGGGGKGMRRVDDAGSFAAALASAQREGLAAFGSARVLIERYIAAPRHVEIQIIADTYGNILHLNERDCSLQRRHQKVIEEAPAPGLSAAARGELGRRAVNAGRAVGYVGAGTVEFIAEGGGAIDPDRCWFMEMNTRLQVEHPVTEATTGLDLVEWQFRIAAGERLPFEQDAVRLDGHAVEARLYAEDPARGFLPSTGRIEALTLPAGEGIRVDAGVEAGDTITAHYDPMIAKVIAHAPTRAQALDRLAAALDATRVAGPRTNLALLAALCRAEDFRAGRFDTHFIERHADALIATGRDDAAVAAGVAALLARDARRLAPAGGPASPWAATDGFQLGGARAIAITVAVDGERVAARVAHGPNGASVTVGGAAPADDADMVETLDAMFVLRHGRQSVVRWPTYDGDALAPGAVDGAMRAPMHGRLIAVLAEPGAMVTRGTRLAVIEAMKMEHVLLAPRDGRIGTVAAAAGQQVAEGAMILTIEAAGDPT